MKQNFPPEGYIIVKKKYYSFLKRIGLFFVILGFLSLALLLYFDFVYKANFFLTISSNGDTAPLEEEKKEPGKPILEIKTENVSVSAPIVEGVELKDLEQGVGHHKTTAWPGLTGNVVLAGHNWYPCKSRYCRVFCDLEKLKIGDEVAVYYNQGEFVYKVIERKVVSPKHTEVLKQTEEPALTLYTCYPRLTAKQRLVYVAKLISWKKVQE